MVDTEGGEITDEHPYVAIFHLYRIAEILEKKYGGETKAKTALGVGNEFKRIGKIANASYGDIRHAPNPDVTIEELTPEQLQECRHDAETLAMQYIEKLLLETTG